ncbi:hypothetical protein [Flammeovirga aprica]|uniref:Uncharacterized protein n=1 Tax=Flammeovirga aprica JL-4 TaxID=694437 RepID=A0A7X9XCJ2_9BACT|nr:hypothetical protein [Flammeovirga aprica]NME71891.1 hypothetical protein [Flammeovirga aprica JL-4]
MKTSKILFLALIFLYACNQPQSEKTEVVIAETKVEPQPQKKENVSVEVPKDTIIQTKVETQVSKEKVIVEPDCIFDDDIKGITTKWVNQLGYKSFQWDSLNYHIAVARDQDSLFLSQGGCYHFNTSVILKATSNIGLDSMDYWIEECIKLAKETGFKDYENSLSDYSYSIENHSAFQKIILINVENAMENIVYNGIVLKKDNDIIEISISEYIN